MRTPPLRRPIAGLLFAVHITSCHSWQSASSAVTVPMVYRRLPALCELVSLLLVYSYTNGSSPVGQPSAGRAIVALNTVFPQGTTADQTADITRIRVTVKRVSDDSIVAVCHRIKPRA